LAGELASQFQDVHFVACKTVRAAVDGADVICATPSERPLFDLSDIGTRAHVNAIGFYGPEMCELDPAMLNAATMVVVDREGAARSGSGELVWASRFSELELVELGALLDGDVPTSESGGITVFKSVGVAV
jgi:ornithine cyclodeaminase/alanine dehydrogenase-like protein (mu-crystallin family)